MVFFRNKKCSELDESRDKLANKCKSNVKTPEHLDVLV